MRNLLTNDEIEIFRNGYLDIAQKKFNDIFTNIYEVNSIDEMLLNEVSNQRTQQLTSILSPLNEVNIRKVSELIPGWEFIGKKGSDSTLKHEPMEHKLSLSDSNSWTGHPYSDKAGLHLLMKLQFSGVKISSLCMFLINLNKCSPKSQWPRELTSTHSYATLKIHKDDIDQVIPIFGSMKVNRIWCKPIFEKICE